MIDLDTSIRKECDRREVLWRMPCKFTTCKLSQDAAFTLSIPTASRRLHLSNAMNHYTFWNNPFVMVNRNREKESPEPIWPQFDWSPCNRVVTVFVAAAAPIDDRIRIRPSRVRSLSGEAKPDFDKVPRASIWTDGERRKVSGMSFETDLLMRTTTDKGTRWESHVMDRRRYWL